MAIRIQLVNLNRFNRGILMLGSLMFPLVGLLAGIWYVARPEYEGDELGYWCLILCFVNILALALLRYFIWA